MGVTYLRTKEKIGKSPMSNLIQKSTITSKRPKVIKTLIGRAFREARLFVI